MSEKNQLQVEAIRHGSVIDHVPAGQGIKILKLFQLIETQERITVGFNLKSGALGKKDLIKIENTRLTEQQANQLALFAPKATVNIIEDFVVVKKHQLALPEFIEGVFHCPNSNCISHN
ncbi:aspartate carbamoyltransferase regulatory subunit, partial [Aeromonas sp. CPF2-S1]|nr:aspartate carbamoyltransferase regulatory subunit [Aeromonas sp. CPF2-S1]